jgi:2-polyprenyl-3-methyl-5-hydroxy-6-metoxy-1,4-benzoquinol methylase
MKQGMMSQEAGRRSSEFSFGKNWETFVRAHYSDDRVEISRRHLLGFLERSDLEGLSFLDIGCGSGIHSLAAFRSGAERIVGIDVDPRSVAATRKIREMAGSPSNWEVREGSILDEDFLSGIEPADIVYSWGVLHHTGDLWRAVRNAGSLLKSGGLFYIALYERTAKSDYWTAVKREYNRAAPLKKRTMEWSHVYNTFFRTWSPKSWIRSMRYITGYRESRGMEFWTDVRDWLGGWPYEPATADEVTSFCEGELGLSAMRVKTGEANVEYLFARRG